MTTTQPENVGFWSRIWSQKRAKNLYRVMWRWHFYMGLLITPILIIVSVAGSIYVFKDELEPLMYPDLMFVTPSTEPTIPPSQAIAAAEAKLPNNTVHGLSAHADPQRAWVVHTENEAKEHTAVYINQHSGQPLGTKGSGEGFFSIVIKIHRQLLAGTFGRIVIEISVAWGIIAIITGLYLWWPRTKEKLRGVFTIRTGKSRKLFWRDLHAVPAVYISLFALAIMFTGMSFTYINRYIFLGPGLALGQIPELYISAPKANVQDNVTPLGIDEITKIFQDHTNLTHFSIVLPHDSPDQAYRIQVNDKKDITSSRLMFIDPYGGEILGDLYWDKLTPYAKMLLYFYPIHVGSIYGLPTKILAFISCWVIVLMSVSGVVMWWQRKPAGSLVGAPPKPKTAVLPRVVTILTIFFSILFPMVGITLLLILLGSWLSSLYSRYLAPKLASN